MKKIKLPLPGLGNPGGSSLISYSPSPNSYAKSQGCSVDSTSLTCVIVKYRGAKELANEAKDDPPVVVKFTKYVHSKNN